MIIKLLVAIIKIYRLTLSPFLGPRCRFDPTCSMYAVHSLQYHGLKEGSRLVVKRLMKCHPIKFLGGNSGYDPVPRLGISSKASPDYEQESTHS